MAAVRSFTLVDGVTFLVVKTNIGLWPLDGRSDMNYEKTGYLGLRPSKHVRLLCSSWLVAEPDAGHIGRGSGEGLIKV